jgi:ribosomal protein S18 acetylase RimI-like enzyme
MRALEHHFQDATAARREEFAGGVAYSNPALPAVWDLNFLRLDRPCPQPALEADRLQAGLGHRKVMIEEPRLVARFGPGLCERGFGETELIALAREPGGVLDPSVRELPFEDVRPLRRLVSSEQLTPGDPAVIGQLQEAAALAARAGARWLVVFDGDQPVGHCVVYSHDGLAQIEDVAVLEAFRGRGLSRRLLEHALEVVAPDHDMSFIVAEGGDWPVGFYERLAFERVEVRAQYLLILAEGS